jgi:hypothetical protein
MSVELEINLAKPIIFQQLVAAAAVSIRDLLGVTQVPRITIEEMVKGRRGALITRELSSGSGMLLVGLEGFEDFATVTVINLIDVPPSYSNGFETPLRAIVSSTRSPLGYSLAACVATALARLEGRTIIDEATFWTSVREQSADSFARLIALKEMYQTIPAAAEAMYAKMKARA